MDSRSRPNAKRLRAVLLNKGHTMASFARDFGYKPRTVKAAVRGERRSKLSLEILAQIKNAPSRAA
jgi:transposase-like protein